MGLWDIDGALDYYRILPSLRPPLSNICQILVQLLKVLCCEAV